MNPGLTLRTAKRVVEANPRVVDWVSRYPKWDWILTELHQKRNGWWLETARGHHHFSRWIIIPVGSDLQFRNDEIHGILTDGNRVDHHSICHGWCPFHAICWWRERGIATGKSMGRDCWNRMACLKMASTPWNSHVLYRNKLRLWWYIIYYHSIWCYVMLFIVI